MSWWPLLLPQWDTGDPESCLLPRLRPLAPGLVLQPYLPWSRARWHGGMTQWGLARW